MHAHLHLKPVWADHNVVQLYLGVSLRCFIVECNRGSVCGEKVERLSSFSVQTKCAALTHLYEPDNTYQTWRRAVCLGSVLQWCTTDTFIFQSHFMVHAIKANHYFLWSLHTDNKEVVVAYVLLYWKYKKNCIKITRNDSSKFKDSSSSKSQRLIDLLRKCCLQWTLLVRSTFISWKQNNLWITATAE